MKAQSFSRAAGLTVAALALAMSLTGCSALTDLLQVGKTDAQRDDSGSVTESANIDIFALKVGDCMPQSEGGVISEADVVPCAEPHADEVYWEFTLPEGDFPTTEALSAAIEAECLPAFETFAGIAYDASALEVYTIEPTAETWAQADDRVVQCVVYDPAGDVTGSLKGSAR